MVLKARCLSSDGSATATIWHAALIEEAQRLGVSFHARVRVRRSRPSGRIHAIETTRPIETETLVVAPGLVAADRHMAGVSLALTPMQHQYVVTAPLPELAGRTIANLRDPDKLVYLRQRDESWSSAAMSESALFSVEAIPDRTDPTVRTSMPVTLSNSAARWPNVFLSGDGELAKGVNG